MFELIALRLRPRRSVAGILASFHKAIARLEAVAVARNEELNRLNAARRQIDAYEAAALEELNAADAAHKKLAELVGQ